MTERLRLGPFVLNAAFTQPTMLARDVTTVDQLSGGRVELGVGAGYVKGEFDAAGIDYLPAGRRVDHLAETVRRVVGHLDDPDFRLRPHQRRVPLLLGGNGDRVLRMAATQADIVGLTGARTGPTGGMDLMSSTDFDERVAFARRAAGDRANDVEWNLLVQVVAVTDDPAAVVEPMLSQFGVSEGVEDFVALPTVLVGSAAEIADKLIALRERTGISYITVLEPALHDFASVIPLLRDRTDPAAI